MNLRQRTEYFSEITQLIEYLILPPEVFSNRPLRYFFRDLLVNTVFLPSLDQISDPDFINQMLVKSCKTRRYTTPLSESFLHVIRCCSNANELQAVYDMVDKEIAFQRSKDIGGDDDFEIKQQLSSLQYVKSLITSRLVGLQEGVTELESPVLASNPEITNFTNTGKMFQIPFEVIVKNNVALSYFFEYMSGVNAQSYLYFYLNVDGFKTSAEQHLSEIALLETQPFDTDKRQLPNIEILREAALNIYDTYLNPDSDNANKLQLDEHVCRSVLQRINHESLSDSWFDQVHLLVYEKMRTDEHLFVSFKKSIHYVKLLAELDLLKECQVEPTIESKDGKTSGKGDLQATIGKPSSSSGEGQEDTASVKSFNSYDSQSVCSLEAVETAAVLEELSAEIISTGITKEFGHTFGVYCVGVVKRNVQAEADKDKESKWYVIRRYSDFYQFHQQTVKHFPQLSRLAIPGKRPFNNVSQEFLNQRMRQLNAYLQQLIRLYNNAEYEQHYKFNRHLLREHIFKFVDINSNDGYNKPHSSAAPTNSGSTTAPVANSQLQKTVNSVLNPFKSSFKSVMKSGQDNFIDGLQKLKNLNQNPNHAPVASTSSAPILQSQPTLVSCSRSLKTNDSNRPTADRSAPSLILPSPGSATSLNERGKPTSPNVRYHGLQSHQEPSIAMGMEIEPSSNIPTRILLLLLDEIFELRNKNFWLRRRIIAVVKQIIQTTYGGTINKKVIQLIQKFFGASSIADHIRSLKKSLWPNGYRALPQPERSEQVKLNTKTAALMLLLSTLPDDLKHMIGAETSRHGVTTLFNMFQYPELNARLLICMFECLLLELFPNQHLDAVFERLHSFGERAQNQNSDQSPHHANDSSAAQWPPYWSKISQHQVRLSSGQTSSSTSKSSSSKSSPFKPKKSN
jgi:sorting nexin-13